MDVIPFERQPNILSKFLFQYHSNTYRCITLIALYFDVCKIFCYLVKPVLLVFIQRSLKFVIKMIIGNTLICVTYVMAPQDTTVKEIMVKTILVTLVPSDALLKEVEMLLLWRFCTGKILNEKISIILFQFCRI